MADRRGDKDPCAESSVISASAMRRRSSWKGCTGSSIAATTRRASPAPATTSSAFTRPRARSASWSGSCPTQLQGHARHRAHALGDARRAERPQRASAQRRRGRFAIVHNGIIENAAAAAREAAKRGGVVVSLRDRLRGARASDRGDARGHARRGGARRAAARDRHLRPRRARRAATRIDRRRAQRQPGRARHRRSRDVRRVRSGGAGAPHAERRASRRRRDRGRARRRLRDLDARWRHDREDALDHRVDRTSRSTRAATRTSCARRSPSSPKRSAAR